MEGTKNSRERQIQPASFYSYVQSKIYCKDSKNLLLQFFVDLFSCNQCTNKKKESVRKIQNAQSEPMLEGIQQARNPHTTTILEKIICSTFLVMSILFVINAIPALILCFFGEKFAAEAKSSILCETAFYFILNLSSLFALLFYNNSCKLVACIISGIIVVFPVISVFTRSWKDFGLYDQFKRL